MLTVRLRRVECIETTWGMLAGGAFLQPANSVDSSRQIRSSKKGSLGFDGSLVLRNRIPVVTGGFCFVGFPLHFVYAFAHAGGLFRVRVCLLSRAFRARLFQALPSPCICHLARDSQGRPEYRTWHGR